MSRTGARLRGRREALLRQAALHRRLLGLQVGDLESSIAGVDDAIDRVRRVATAPVLIAGGVLGLLVLGRSRTQRLLVSALALAGLVSRVRTTGQVLGQLVSRSR